MSETNDLFVLAARKKFRFPSIRGPLTVEQLWDLPLLGRGSGAGFDLDSVAREVNNHLKEMGEESFVERENPERATTAAKLDVVKFIIARKQEEAKAAELKIEKATRARKIRDILAEKQDAALSSASEEELRKMLAEAEAA